MREKARIQTKSFSKNNKNENSHFHVDFQVKRPNKADLRTEIYKKANRNK
jgi:hypothetical protein